MVTTSSPSGFRYLGSVLVIAAVYAFTGMACLKLTFLHNGVALIWPPVGWAVAVLILWGRRLWPGVFLGALVLNFLYGMAPEPMATFAAVGTVWPMVAAWLLRRVKVAPALTSTRDVLLFVLVGVFTVPAFSSTTTAWFLVLFDWAPEATFSQMWFDVWMGDGLSVLIISPLVMVWGTASLSDLKGRRALLVALGVLLTVLSAVPGLVAEWHEPDHVVPLLKFLPLPVIIWLGVCCGRRGVVTATFLTSALVVAVFASGASEGLGDHVPEVNTDELFALMMTYALGGLIAAAAMAERHEAVEKALSSERRLADAQRMARLGNWEVERSTGRFWGSTELMRIFGFPPSLPSVDFDRLLATVLEDDRAILSGRYEETLRQATPLDIKVRIRPEGASDTGWVHIRARHLYDHSEEPIGSRGTVQDITKLKRAEEYLRQSIQEWTMALDAFDDAVFLVDTRRRLLRANKAFYAMVGQTAEEAVGRPVSDLLHPDGEIVPCPVCKAQLELRDETMVLEVGTTDFAQDKPLEAKVQVLRGDGAEPQAILVRLHDLSTSRTAAHALRDSEERFRALFENSPISLWELDLSGLKILRDRLRVEKGVDIRDWVEDRPDLARECLKELRVVAVNRATRRLLEADETQLIGADLDWSYTDDGAIRLAQDVSTSFEGGSEYVTEVPARAASGRKMWVKLRATVAPGYGETWSRVFLSMQDLTEQRQSERRLQMTIDALSRSNTELERFAWIAAHDLQEPVRTVVTYAQFFERRVAKDLDTESRELLNFLVGGARRIGDLVRDLMTYSKVAAHGQTFVSVDMNHLVQSVKGSLARALKEAGGTITVEPLPMVMGDSVQLTELMQNLIANALKFRRDGVPPVIEVSSRAGEHGEWVFSVSDNGIGIEPAYFDDVFVIFKRLHTADNYPGTGVGLAVCKRIVERHGGRIWVDSVVGEGTTFHFTLH